MSDFTEEYVNAVRAAEAAAQRSVCEVPQGDLPDELASALDKRVEVNLAQADGVTVTRVGSADPEVRALEAAFARRRSSTEEPVKRDSHRRRTTRKKAQPKKGNS